MTLETTTLDRRWLAKMIIGFLVLTFFGFYGLYDALIAYPNRGVRHASFCEFQYLQLASEQGRLGRHLIIEDPAAEYARLREADRRTLSDRELARLEWLRSLSRIGPWSLRPSHLSAEYTSFQPQNAQFVDIGGPQGRLAELREQWTTAQGAGQNAPKALAAYDIPIQWVFVIVGFGGAAYLAGLFLAVSRLRFRWEPESQTLHLPSGVNGGKNVQTTLTPDDIEEFDKRKWHKFLIFLKIRPEHPILGGRELRLDLYRYAHLESWILEMEKTAFPENVAESQPTPAEEHAAETVST